MTKRQIIATLKKIANELDSVEYYKEANNITRVMIKVADEFNDVDLETTAPVAPPDYLSTTQKPQNNMEDQSQKDARRKEILDDISNRSFAHAFLNNELKYYLQRADVKDERVTIQQIISAWQTYCMQIVKDVLGYKYNSAHPREADVNLEIEKKYNQFVRQMEESLNSFRIPLRPVIYLIDQAKEPIYKYANEMEEKLKAYHDF